MKDFSQTKIILMLQLLAPPEIKYVRKLLSSDFFNSNQDVLQLFETLIEYYPKFDDSQLNKATLGRKVFGKTEFPEHRFRLLISELTRKIEWYLAHENFVSNDLETSVSLVKGMEKHKVGRPREVEIEKCLKQLNVSMEKTLSEGLYIKQYQLLQASLNFAQERAQEKKEIAALHNILLCADKLWFINKVKTLLMNGVSENIPSEYLRMLEVVERESIIYTEPLPKMYILVLKCLNENHSPKLLKKLREMYELHYSSLNEDDDQLIRKFLEE
jgi:hypothetical protein